MTPAAARWHPLSKKEKEGVFVLVPLSVIFAAVSLVLGRMDMLLVSPLPALAVAIGICGNEALLRYVARSKQ